MYVDMTRFGDLEELMKGFMSLLAARIDAGIAQIEVRTIQALVTNADDLAVTAVADNTGMDYW